VRKNRNRVAVTYAGPVGIATVGRRIFSRPDIPPGNDHQKKLDEIN
jgi:hypothetical protein